MFCDYCGEFNEDSNLLCKNCGKSLYESITENNGYYNSLETNHNLNSKLNISDILLEWDTIIIASFIFVISFEAINLLSKPFAYIFGTLVTCMYAVIVVNHKWTLVFTLPLILLLILSFNAYFVL